MAQAYIADITPPEERSKRMGLVGMAFGLGFIFGPALGGLFSLWGPRAPFVAAALLALVKERPQHDQSNGGGHQGHQAHTTTAAGQQRPRAGTLSRVLTSVAAWQRGLLPVQK